MKQDHDDLRSISQYNDQRYNALQAFDNGFNFNSKLNYEQYGTLAKDQQVGGDHYKSMAIQPFEYIVANGLGFLEGNVIKYVSRYKSKGGVADLEKAIHSLQLLIEEMKKQ